jgi:hypothetical protein
MPATHSTIYLGSTTLVKVNGLRDTDGNYQNNATVTIESLTDRVTGQAVTGITVPFSLSYVTSSNGNYQGVISDSLGVVEGGQYIAILKAELGSGQVKEWSEHIRAQYARA